MKFRFGKSLGRRSSFPKVSFGDGPECPNGEHSVANGQDEGDDQVGVYFKVGIVLIVANELIDEMNGKEGGGTEVKPNSPEDDGFGAGAGSVRVSVVVGRFELPGMIPCGGIERGPTLSAA